MPEPKVKSSRGRGRPRQLPEGARRRKWWATDGEYALVKAAASRAGEAGVSAEEWVRRVVLAAAEKVGRVR